MNHCVAFRYNTFVPCSRETLRCGSARRRSRALPGASGAVWRFTRRLYSGVRCKSANSFLMNGSLWLSLHVLFSFEKHCLASISPPVLLGAVLALKPMVVRWWQRTNLVDPASSHMLVSKIKPCMSQYKLLYGETANGSLKQL